MFVELSPAAIEHLEALARSLDGTTGGGWLREILDELDAPELLEVFEDPDLDPDDPPNFPQETEGPKHGLRCPHCGATTWDGDDEGVRVVDIALRWNSFGYAHGGGSFAGTPHAITGSYDGDYSFEGDHYECEACDRRVSLPDNVTEEG